jgi:hypothetical protein
MPFNSGKWQWLLIQLSTINYRNSYNPKAVPALTSYSYALSGYLGSDASADSITGSINGTTSYVQGNGVGTYNINYSTGALTSAMGYSVSYANNTSALNVLSKGLTISGTIAEDKVYDTTNTASFNTNSSALVGIVLSDSITLNNGSVSATFNNPKPLPSLALR